MSKIKNTPTIDDPKINAIRNAIEHRATWFFLLMDEMKKSGCDAEAIGRAAILRCGTFHGLEKMMKHCPDPDDLREFLKVFADDTGLKLFEMEILESSPQSLSLDFHYCPLVSAWKKLGASDDEIALLCDIAMEGDRGITSQFDGYKFFLGQTIASGDPVCEIRITKYVNL